MRLQPRRRAPRPARDGAPASAGDAVRADPRSLVAAIAVATAAVLPAFLTGALAVQLQGDLGFGPTGLGLAVGAFFATGALTSAAGGRLSERLGPQRAMRVAASFAAAALLGVAVGARSWGTLLPSLMLGGLANAIAQPATNLFLARVVPPGRQGTAFGVKQSAIPTATLLGGLAVPALALTVGWRWAFALGAVAAAVVVARVPRPPGAPPPSRRRSTDDGDVPLGPLAVLATGSGLGAAAAGTIGAFLVASAVDAGLAEGTAGVLLTAGSAVGLIVRLAAGVRADRRGRAHLPVVASMLALGTAGYALLATAMPPLLVVGAMVAFGAGWGWPGLFNLAVVRTNPNAPGAATGITPTGTYIGAVIGPLVFGAVAESWSYSAAWLVSGAMSLAAAGAVLTGRRLLLASRSHRPARR